jgi:hypothetical protein
MPTVKLELETASCPLTEATVILIDAYAIKKDFPIVAY